MTKRTRRNINKLHDAKEAYNGTSFETQQSNKASRTTGNKFSQMLSRGK